MLAAAYQTERLGTSLALVDADEPLRELNNLASPVQAVRDVFDLMSYESVSDWEIAARRMAAVPEALRGLRATYEEGRSRQIVAARRQALAAADQAGVWSGEGAQRPFFEALIDRADHVDGVERGRCARRSTRRPWPRRWLTASWPPTSARSTPPRRPRPTPSGPSAT